MIRITKPKPVQEHCYECDKETTFRPECFDYAGTHCTNGQSGTHYTGVYECEECGSELDA